METVKIGPQNDILSPPKDQPDLPGQPPKGTEKPPGASPAALQGTISETDAIKATDSSKFNTLLIPQRSNATTGNQGSNSVPVSGLVDGALAVELIDALIPALLVVLLHVLKLEMKKTQLQLTVKEKTTLTPLVKACMDQLMINFNTPWAALGVSMVIIYGAKIGEFGIVSALDKKAEKQQAKKNESVTNKVQEQKPEVILQPVQKVNPAPVVKINPESIPKWEPSDEQIWEGMKRRKVSRKEIIDILKKHYREGTLEQFFQKKPFKRSK